MNRDLNKQALNQYFTKPWYFHPLTISVLFAMWFFLIPPIVGLLLLIANKRDDSKKRERIANLNLDKVAELDILEKQIKEKTLHDKSLGLLAEVKKQYKETKNKLSDLTAEIKAKTNHVAALSTLEGAQKELGTVKEKYKQMQNELKDLEKQILHAEGEIEVQDAGFYGLDFDASTSAQYKAQMIELQDKQKAMVKDKTACDFAQGITYNGSLSAGKKMIRQHVRMALWSFNTHCDNVIVKVTYRNRGLSERKINKAFEIINSNDELVSISYDYLRLKLEELDTTYKYKEQLEYEKELLREQREKEREERKLQQEIARERAKIEKDETHINVELARLQKLLLEEQSDKEKLRKEITGLESTLESLNKKKADIDYRENNSKAGYVYIISNIGAFGKDVIKIGVTRRLEPIERINELGDASVPFRFDVHALVFSDQAYKLEKALHDKFSKNRINKVNSRKEFFKIPLKDVRKAVIEEFKDSIEFDMETVAKEFKQSLRPVNGL